MFSGESLEKSESKVPAFKVFLPHTEGPSIRIAQEIADGHMSFIAYNIEKTGLTKTAGLIGAVPTVVFGIVHHIQQESHFKEAMTDIGVDVVAGWYLPPAVQGALKISELAASVSKQTPEYLTIFPKDSEHEFERLAEQGAVKFFSVPFELAENIKANIKSSFPAGLNGVKTELERQNTISSQYLEAYDLCDDFSDRVYQVQLVSGVSAIGAGITAAVKELLQVSSSDVSANIPRQNEGTLQQHFHANTDSTKTPIITSIDSNLEINDNIANIPSQTSHSTIPEPTPKTWNDIRFHLDGRQHTVETGLTLNHTPLGVNVGVSIQGNVGWIENFVNSRMKGNNVGIDGEVEIGGEKYQYEVWTAWGWSGKKRELVVRQLSTGKVKASEHFHVKKRDDAHKKNIPIYSDQLSKVLNRFVQPQFEAARGLFETNYNNHLLENHFDEAKEELSKFYNKYQGYLKGFDEYKLKWEDYVNSSEIDYRYQTIEQCDESGLRNLRLQSVYEPYQQYIEQCIDQKVTEDIKIHLHDANFEQARVRADQLHDVTHANFIQREIDKREDFFTVGQVKRHIEQNDYEQAMLTSHKLHDQQVEYATYITQCQKKHSEEQNRSNMAENKVLNTQISSQKLVEKIEEVTLIVPGLYSEEDISAPVVKSENALEAKNDFFQVMQAKREQARHRYVNRSVALEKSAQNLRLIQWLIHYAQDSEFKKEVTRYFGWKMKDEKYLNFITHIAYFIAEVTANDLEQRSRYMQLLAASLNGNIAFSSEAVSLSTWQGRFLYNAPKLAMALAANALSYVAKMVPIEQYPEVHTVLVLAFPTLNTYFTVSHALGKKLTIPSGSNCIFSILRLAANSVQPIARMYEVRSEKAINIPLINSIRLAVSDPTETNQQGGIGWDLVMLNIAQMQIKSLPQSLAKEVLGTVMPYLYIALTFQSIYSFGKSIHTAYKMQDILQEAKNALHNGLKEIKSNNKLVHWRQVEDHLEKLSRYEPLEDHVAEIRQNLILQYFSHNKMHLAQESINQLPEGMQAAYNIFYNMQNFLNAAQSALTNTDLSKVENYLKVEAHLENVFNNPTSKPIMEIIHSEVVLQYFSDNSAIVRQNLIQQGLSHNKLDLVESSINLLPKALQSSYKVQLMGSLHIQGNMLIADAGLKLVMMYLSKAYPSQIIIYNIVNVIQDTSVAYFEILNRAVLRNLKVNSFSTVRSLTDVDLGLQVGRSLLGLGEVLWNYAHNNNEQVKLHASTIVWVADTGLYATRIYYGPSTRTVPPNFLQGLDLIARGGLIAQNYLRGDKGNSKAFLLSNAGFQAIVSNQPKAWYMTAWYFATLSSRYPYALSSLAAKILPDVTIANTQHLLNNLMLQTGLNKISQYTNNIVLGSNIAFGTYFAADITCDSLDIYTLYLLQDTLVRASHFAKEREIDNALKLLKPLNQPPTSCQDEFLLEDFCKTFKSTKTAAYDFVWRTNISSNKKDKQCDTFKKNHLLLGGNYQGLEKKFHELQFYVVSLNTQEFIKNEQHEEAEIFLSSYDNLHDPQKKQYQRLRCSVKLDQISTQWRKNNTNSAENIFSGATYLQNDCTEDYHQFYHLFKLSRIEKLIANGKHKEAKASFPREMPKSHKATYQSLYCRMEFEKINSHISNGNLTQAEKVFSRAAYCSLDFKAEHQYFYHIFRLFRIEKLVSAHKYDEAEALLSGLSAVPKTLKSEYQRLHYATQMEKVSFFLRSDNITSAENTFFNLDYCLKNSWFEYKYFYYYLTLQRERVNNALCLQYFSELNSEQFSVLPEQALYQFLTLGTQIISHAQASQTFWSTSHFLYVTQLEDHIREIIDTQPNTHHGNLLYLIALNKFNLLYDLGNARKTVRQAMSWNNDIQYSPLKMSAAEQYFQLDKTIQFYESRWNSFVADIVFYVVKQYLLYASLSRSKQCKPSLIISKITFNLMSPVYDVISLLFIVK